MPGSPYEVCALKLRHTCGSCSLCVCLKKMIFLPSVYSPLGRRVVALQRPVWASAPVLVQPCSASPRVPHTHLPSWPVVACVAGSPVRGRWGRLSRWCVAGAGDGSGHPGGPRATGEMPRPCSSAMKSKRKLTSCPTGEVTPEGPAAPPPAPARPAVRRTRHLTAGLARSPGHAPLPTKPCLVSLDPVLGPGLWGCQPSRGSRQSHAGALRCYLRSPWLLLVTWSCSRLPGPHAAVSLTLACLCACVQRPGPVWGHLISSSPEMVSGSALPPPVGWGLGST